MIFRRICDLFNFIFLLFFYINQPSVAEVFYRTNSNSIEDTTFVAFDFKLGVGEHIVAPSTAGSSNGFGLTFENAEIIGEHWPETEDLAEISENARGYKDNFSVIYELKIKDKAKPVKYDLFYVVCGDTCMPKEESGEINPNGLLLDDEIAKITNKPIKGQNLGLMLLFGFLGGLILNFMPCVFPIISLKVFSIAKIAKQSKKSIRTQSLAFSVGIFATFLTLGGILNVLKEITPGIGWGFYMQEPKFVFALLLMFLVCAIHFLGIYHFKMPSFKKHKLPIKSALVASFFSGAFSGIASASCVGPFAGVALAGALLYGNLIHSLFIFLSLCFGVAFPFVLISIFPKIINKFPEPGNWINVFKSFMGHAMLLSCIWPFSILLKQIPNANVIGILVIIISTAFCFWLLGHFQRNKICKAIAFFGIAILTTVGFCKATAQIENQKIEWIAYSEKAFDNAREKGQPIFMNFTATWCMNCQFNQRIFSDPEVISAFDQNNILAIKCDWTNEDYQITNLMKKYNSVAVPLYVYYPGTGSKFEILPTILTKQKILEVINNGIR